MVTKKVLEELYLKKLMTSREIAREYNISKTSVLNWLKKYNIPVRNCIYATKLSAKKRRINIKKELLEELYIKKKMSLPQMSRLLCIDGSVLLSRMVEYGIPRRTISEANKGGIVLNTTREQISKKSKGKHYSPETEFKRGHKISEKTKEKMSETWKEKFKNNPKLREERSLRGKRNWENKEYRDRHIKMITEKWKTKEYSEKVIKNTLSSLLKRPTSLEKKFIKLIKKYNLPYKYVGDGSAIIGYKNPDFINTNGEKICIEVANKFHHQPPWEGDRIKHFAKWGWECLVFFCDNKTREFEESEEQILNKIRGEYGN